MNMADKKKVKGMSKEIDHKTNTAHIISVRMRENESIQVYKATDFQH